MIPQTKWQFYSGSEDAWDAMLQEMEKAEKSIDLEQYILINDSIGNKFIDLCIKKASEKVKVRIFCDEVGSFPLRRSGVREELAKKNIDLFFFNSVLPWNPNRESLWYFRDHRKLLIIDNKIAFTGGVCLAEEMKSWWESNVRIEGPVVGQMKSAFDVMWNKQYRTAQYIFKKDGPEFADDEFKYLTNSPLPGKRFMYRELIQAIKAAKNYVYLTTPYFAPDSRLLKSIKQARKRGVEVRLLVPMRPNHILIDIASRTFFEDLLKHNVRIFRYERSMIHSKTAVIDGHWSTIGSLNFDNISLRYNFEANIVSTNSQFAFELEKQFLEDIKLSKELVLEEWEKRPLRQKMAEILVWPIRKFL